MEKFRPSGVCCVEIQYELEGDTIKQVRFIGGCRGNTQGVAKLCENRKVEDVINLLSGIQCRNGTSCPDQLAIALKQHLNK